MSDWLPEYDNALRAHFEAGLSAAMAAAQINATFGLRKSRSAVIGRAQRQKMHMSPGKGGRQGPKGGPSQRKPRPRAASSQRPDTAIRKAASAPKLGSVSFVPRPDPRPGAVPLLDLAPDGCRWPSGDHAPTMLFCNEPKIEGLSYCGPHCQIAYRVRYA